MAAGCGLENSVKTEDFKYSFSENICQTGEHSFATKMRCA